MYATIRRYAGNAKLADVLNEHSGEVRELIGGIPGIAGYYLIRAGADTISITVAEDEAGAARSNEIAKSWLAENIPDAAPSAPEISAGEVLVSLEPIRR
jgi:hypothetical protein